MASISEESRDEVRSSDQPETDSDEIDDGYQVLISIWTNQTSWLKQIKFLDINELKVPISGDGLPMDLFNLLVDVILGNI